MNVLPVDLVALSAVVLGCLMFLIPIAGLTARYAIKPIAEALTRSREGSADRETVQLLERRVALIEQELHASEEQRAEMGRVLEELRFRRELDKPAT
jgi:predicted Ser/Thr protein kinase